MKIGVSTVLHVENQRSSAFLAEINLCGRLRIAARARVVEHVATTRYDNACDTLNGNSVIALKCAFISDKFITEIAK